MKELLNKEYEIELPYADKKFIFKYKEGTLQDILEYNFYLEKGGEDFVNYIYNFLHKIEPQFTQERLAGLTPENFLEVTNYLRKTYCKGFYQEEETKAVAVEQAPFSSLILFIQQHSNETLDTLLNMPWERINFITEGIIWNINEQTPDGKRDNRKAAHKKAKKEGTYTDTLDKLKAQRERINKKFNTK